MAAGRPGPLVSLSPFLGALLTLFCSLGAHGARKDYYLKRYPGDVDSLCLSSKSKAIPDIADADALLIGTKKGVQANGKRCAEAVPYTRTSSARFQMMSDLPPVFATTSFNTSLWAASPGDTVAYSADNRIPRRPLSIIGTPTPVDLSAPGLNDPNPSQISLAPQPAASFNVSFDNELATVGKFLNWFYSVYYNPKGLQGAILIEPDSDDADGKSWETLYFIFKQDKDNIVTGHLFVATFSLSPSAASGGPQRRLLSMRGRKLLQYDGGYGGGTDATTGKTCNLTCKYVSGKWTCRCS